MRDLRGHAAVTYCRVFNIAVRLARCERVKKHGFVAVGTTLMRQHRGQWQHAELVDFFEVAVVLAALGSDVEWITD